jgi:hypothetical protein
MCDSRRRLGWKSDLLNYSPPDYTLQIIIIQILVLSVTAFTAMLGSGFKRHCSPSSVFPNCLRPQLTAMLGGGFKRHCSPSSVFPNCLRPQLIAMLGSGFKRHCSPYSVFPNCLRPQLTAMLGSGFKRQFPFLRVPELFQSSATSSSQLQTINYLVVAVGPRYRAFALSAQKTLFPIGLMLLRECLSAIVLATDPVASDGSICRAVS